VRTNVFSEPSDATPETKAPARLVQTGGFGSPDAVPGPGRADARGVPSKVGAFDLPAGPGQGNGTAGANGVRGVVTGAGFGAVTDGAPHAGSPDGTAKRGTVTSGAFGDGRPAAGATGPARAAAPAPALETPIEILSKPRPAYTAKARALKIEGEVLLEVVFTTAGQVRVLRVVRGLGHGLDESAAAAAQQMKFKPARRNGLPVDSTVTLHMVFQLA
jgi:TonB family protein